MKDHIRIKWTNILQDIMHSLGKMFWHSTSKINPEEYTKSDELL